MGGASGVSERWNEGREGQKSIPHSPAIICRQCCCCISGMEPTTLMMGNEFLLRVKFRQLSYVLLKPGTPIIYGDSGKMSQFLEISKSDSICVCLHDIKNLIVSHYENIECTHMFWPSSPKYYNSRLWHAACCLSAARIFRSKYSFEMNGRAGRGAKRRWNQQQGRGREAVRQG